MRLCQGAFVHQPQTIRPVQRRRHHPHHRIAHVGLFSILKGDLNLSLTRRRDFRDRQKRMTGETMNLKTFLKHVGNDNSGATAVEYGLSVSLIIIAMIGVLNGVAISTTDMWDDVKAASEEAIAQN